MHAAITPRPATNTRAILLITVAACSIAACSGGGGDERLTANTGQLSLSLIDSPSTDVSEIWLQIDRVRVQPAGDGTLLEFDFDPDLDVDLLTLTPGNPLTLLDGEDIRARDYDWIEIVLNADFDAIADSYVIQRIGGGAVELAVPDQIVRLGGGFTIEADQETSFMLDWDTRQGLIDEPGPFGYTLLHTIRVIDGPSFGTLRGMVAMSRITPATPSNLCNVDSLLNDPDIGNAVYVFAGSDATPDDIDGVIAALDPNADPIATSTVTQDTSGDYRYSVILSPGTYTAAFTCQAGLDDPTLNNILLFSTPIDVDVVAGEETVVDF